MASPLRGLPPSAPPAPAPVPVPPPPEFPPSAPTRSAAATSARGRGTRLRRRIVVGVVTALAVAAGVVVWLRASAAPDVQYVTTPVSRGSIVRTITASGSVNPVITVQVGTYVSGAIQQVLCDYNTAVKKGQLCAQIDPRPYQTVVDQDQANLSAANAQEKKDETNLDYARLTMQRNEDLLAQKIVSSDTVDSAKSVFAQAQAQVDLDKASIAQHAAALAAAKVDLGYTNIVSPVDGTVVSRNVTIGQTVAASFQTPTLFLIATDLTKMQVDANVSESDIAGATQGHPATFTVEAYPDRTFAGQVTQVRQAPQSVQNVVTYDVVASAPNPDLLLKPGMTATIHIEVDRRDNVLRVPDQALRFTPGGVAGGSGTQTPHAAAAGAGNRAHVWVLRNGQTVQVPVTVGLDNDTMAEVSGDGLAPGDQVIVSEQAASGGRSAGSPLRFMRL